MLRYIPLKGKWDQNIYVLAFEPQDTAPVTALYLFPESTDWGEHMNSETLEQMSMQTN